MSDSQVTTLEDTPVVQPKPTKAKQAKPSDDGKKYYDVLIHMTGDDSQSPVVDIQIDGYLTRIPRGVNCRVSEEVLHVLQNAVVTTYKKVGDDVQEVNIPRFPYTATPA